MSTILLILALIVSACAGQQAVDTGAGGEATADGPRSGGTIVWSESDDIRDSLDQDKSNHTPSRMVARHVLETLVVVDPATGEIHPGLATSWEVSEDGKEITLEFAAGRHLP